MTWRTSASLLAGLMALFGGCAGQRSAPLVCSPEGAEEIRFAYQSLRAPIGAAPSLYVMNQNGAEYLFVDGACRYWTYFVSDDVAGHWNEVRTGVLSDAQLAGINADLIEREWLSIHGEVSTDGGLSHYRHFVWSGDHVARCSGLCDGQSAEAHGIREAARRWTRTLHEAGAAVVDRPMRALALPLEGP